VSFRASSEPAGSEMLRRVAPTSCVCLVAVLRLGHKGESTAGRGDRATGHGTNARGASPEDLRAPPWRPGKARGQGPSPQTSCKNREPTSYPPTPRATCSRKPIDTSRPRPPTDRLPTSPAHQRPGPCTPRPHPRGPPPPLRRPRLRPHGPRPPPPRRRLRCPRPPRSQRLHPRGPWPAPPPRPN
jgi:hypothetical protein